MINGLSVPELLETYFNYQPLNQPRRSSLMSYDQRARDSRLRIFLHIITTVYSVPVTCKTRTAVHYNVSCLNY